MDMVIKFLVAAVGAGTPLLFGTVGEILTEKTGHLNLGVEGMMSIGACIGFMVGYYTDNFVFALFFAAQQIQQQDSKKTAATLDRTWCKHKEESKQLDLSNKGLDFFWLFGFGLQDGENQTKKDRSSNKDTDPTV